jgi:hypothetical protein
MKKEKNNLGWQEHVRSSNGVTKDSSYEDLMEKLEKNREEEFDRMVEWNRNYNMEEVRLEME